MENVKNIEEQVGQNIRFFVLFVKSGCPYCRDAIDLLEKYGYQYYIQNLDEQGILLSEVKAVYNWETVPIILGFESHETKPTLIGGCTELKILLNCEE